MKFLYYLLLSSVLFSCKNGDKNDEVRKVTVEKPSVPVTFTVEDSLALSPRVMAHYRNRVLLVDGIDEKKLLDSIYAPVTDILFEYTQESITSALQRRKQDFYDAQRKLAMAKGPEYKQLWTDYRDMKLKSEENGLLTLLYIHEGYTGGVHGFHVQTYKTIDLNNLKKLQLHDIIKTDSQMNWDTLLRKNLRDSDPEVAEMISVAHLSPVENFYIENGQLIFVYNQYEIAPYAAGVITIPVALSTIKTELTPEFSSRNDLK